MTKPELLTALATKSELSKNEVSLVLDALVEIISEEVFLKGDQVSIPGLGVFKQKESAPRNGINPKTGESIQIGAKTKVAFSAASAMKK